MERSDRAGLSAASNAPVGIEALTHPLSLDEESVGTQRKLSAPTLLVQK
jgi:hypothetical protein